MADDLFSPPDAGPLFLRKVQGPGSEPTPNPRRSGSASRRREPVRYPGNLAASLADIRMMIRALDDALVAEGIPPATRRRIVNRVLLGNPEGIGD